MNTFWRALLNSRALAVMPFLGFASGLPLALTAGTLQAWLTVTGVDIETIAIFSLVGLPYTVKFLWSPLMDRYVPLPLGRRRAWMVATQLGLIFGIAAMPMIAPSVHPWLLGSVALAVAFLSASQDIAFDAYRADALMADERGYGAALSVAGYRIGMLVSGAVAMVLSESLGWPTTYWLLAGLMGIGIVASVASIEPPAPAAVPRTLGSASLEPLREFLGRANAVTLLALVVLYKVGDAFAGSLTTAFLIRDLEFTAGEVGIINKGLGLVSLLAGAFCGGSLLPRIGMAMTLLVAGAAQAITNLGFIVLASMPKDAIAMATVVSLENFAGGMGTAAFVALLMALCDHRYTATQYALLSAASSVGRVMLSPLAGYLVALYGWELFFMMTFFAGLPGLALVWILNAPLKALGAEQASK